MSNFGNKPGQSGLEITHQTTKDTTSVGFATFGFMQRIWNLTTLSRVQEDLISDMYNQTSSLRVITVTKPRGLGNTYLKRLWISVTMTSITSGK